MGGHKFQETIWCDMDHRVIDSEAGRRGGKTRGNGAKAFQNIMIDLLEIMEYKSLTGKTHYKQQTPNPCCKDEMPRLLYWFVAPTYKLTKAMKKAFLHYCPPELIQYKNKSSNSIWLYPDIQIEFKSADDPESLVSEGLNGLWITETARMKKRAWNDNLRPCLSDKNGWMLSDTTPLGMNWYVEEIANLADENSDIYDPEHVLYHWKTVDNDKIPGIEEEVAKARRTMPFKDFLRNYEANREAFSGQIYDEFRKSIHVQKFEFDPNRYKVIIGGQDWGYTHHGVLMIVGITYDDEVDIIDEYAYQKINVFKPSEDYVGRTWIEIATEATLKYDLEMIYAGPDRPENISAYNKSGEIICKGANNAVSEGIQFVHSLMTIDENGHTRYRIHPRCKLLIQNKITQKWKENSDGITSEEPEKTNDDANDAERYAIYSAKRWFNIDLLHERENEKTPD
jgi:hypothetical protein